MNTEISTSSRLTYYSVLKTFFLKDYCGLIIANAIFFLCLELLSVANPYLFGKFIDSMVINQSYRQVIHFVVLLLAVFIFNIIISYFNSIFTLKLKYKIEYSFGQFLADKIKHASKINLENNSGVYLQDRIRSDVKVIVDVFFDNLLQIAVKIISLSVICYLVSQINPYLLLVFLLAIPIYILIFFIFQKKLFEISYSVREQSNKFTAIFSKQLEQIKFIRTHTLYDETRNLSENSFEEMLIVAEKQVKLEFFYYSGGWIIKMAGFSTMILMAVKNIFDKTMTIGGLSSGIQYLGQFVDDIGFFLHLGENLQNIRVSFQRINEIASLEQESYGTGTLDSIREIKVQDLSCQLDSGKELFSNINYIFSPGKIYCIQGNNGSGKSTFISILTGLEKGYSGKIFINHMPVTEFDLIHLRKYNLGLVEQHPYLYFSDLDQILLLDQHKYKHGNTEDNAKGTPERISQYLSYFFHPDADLQTIRDEYAKKSMDNDLDVILSGGEKQKLAIIRALSKNADALILDEPTSHLDAHASVKLLKLLKEIAISKIVIVVSHDPKMTASADEIITLGDSSVSIREELPENYGDSTV